MLTRHCCGNIPIFLHACFGYRMAQIVAVTLNTRSYQVVCLFLDSIPAIRTCDCEPCSEEHGSCPLRQLPGAAQARYRTVHFAPSDPSETMPWYEAAMGMMLLQRGMRLETQPVLRPDQMADAQKLAEVVLFFFFLVCVCSLFCREPVGWGGVGTFGHFGRMFFVVPF